MFSKKDIAQYYDVSESQYRFFWNLGKSLSLHYGYWDAGTRNFHEALLNINRVLSQKAAITQSDIVLDAGCGVGGSALWLANNIGCTVTGISLSRKQVEKANVLAAKKQVQHLAKFQEKDFIQTGFANESFTAVWAIESICHAPNKYDFAKEAFRLLKKKGKLIISDFFIKEKMASEEAFLVKKWAHGWAVNSFATVQEFKSCLIDAGFQNIQIEDATFAVRRSVNRLYKAYFIGSILGFLYRITHLWHTNIGQKNIDTARLQYKTFKKNLWKYLIIYAEKN